jgi:hypothetical protein
MTGAAAFGGAGGGAAGRGSEASIALPWRR